MKLICRHTSGPLPTSSFDLVGEAGEVIGFAQVRHRPSCNADLPPAAGNNIYYEIAKAHRGCGHGKTLMTLVLAEAKRIGLQKVRLTCKDDDPVSRHIMESHGAVLVGDFICARGERYHLLEISP